MSAARHPASPLSPSSPASPSAPVGGANDADLEFLGDLLDLQHHAVRMCRLAETRSPRRDVRAYAHASSRNHRHEISVVSSCLRDWVPEVAVRPFAVADTSVRSWMAPTADTDALTHVGAADFDDCFLGLMAAHHRAAITRSRSEMVQGLSPRSRELAESSIHQHSAGLADLDRLSRP